MIRLELQIDLYYQVNDPFGADFVFNIHPARTPWQTLSKEHIALSQAVATEVSTELVTGNRFMRLHAEPGPLTVSYSATVDLDQHRTDPSTLAEVPVRQMPLDVMA